MRLLVPHKFAQRTVVEYRCDQCARVFALPSRTTLPGYEAGIPWHLERDFAKHICSANSALPPRRPVAAVSAYDLAFGMASSLHRFR